MEAMALSLARGVNFNLQRLSTYPELQARFFFVKGVCPKSVKFRFEIAWFGSEFRG